MTYQGTLVHTPIALLDPKNIMNVLPGATVIILWKKDIKVASIEVKS